MENFRPPAMEEVKKKQSSRKTFFLLLLSISIIIAGITTYLGYKHVKVYLSTMLTEEKYKVLTKYYNALTTNDTTTISELTSTEIVHPPYDFLMNQGQFQIYIYPDYQTNALFLLFQLIDSGSGKSYLNEVSYDTNNNKLKISNITTLYSGHQIF